jgi:3D (Asp-Asp-Asp) domain-containing protein
MKNIFKFNISKRAVKRMKKSGKLAVFAIISLILANIALPGYAKEYRDPITVKAVLKAEKKDLISEKIIAYQKEREEKRKIQIARKRAVYPRYKPNSGQILTYATAYTSSVAETDSTPCITADGYNVCQANEENVIASNFLPFGTKVKIPEIYGDKEFIVHDRMNRRYSNRIDIWMKNRNDAIQFGKRQIKIEIVE